MDTFPMPKISIVTICYNSERLIEKTIQSVITQTYSNIEYIIVDGGSTDGTIKIINEYRNYIDVLISESDFGIYDAMNKGIKYATGEWIYFLNSGDRIKNNNIIAYIFYNDLSKYMLIIGNVIYDSNQKFIGEFNRKLWLKNTVHHQAAIYNKKVFEKFRYNIKYNILGDYDLNLYVYKSYKSYIKIDCYFAQCEDGGVSTKIILDKYLEEMAIKKKYLPVILQPINIICVMTKYILKNIIYRWRINNG